MPEFWGEPLEIGFISSVSQKKKMWSGVRLVTASMKRDSSFYFIMTAFLMLLLYKPDMKQMNEYVDTHLYECYYKINQV